MNITSEKLKILNALRGGPQTHKMLRLAYYGEERAKNPSNTSFYNQLQRMMEAELIQKTLVGMYAITALGRESLPKCTHKFHENGGPGDYGPECRDDIATA